MLVGEFSIKKNFFENSKMSNQVIAWLEDNFLNINASKITDKASSTNLISLVDQIKCDLCGKELRVDLSKDLSTIECNMGHVMSRCQRSLLPLDNFDFKTCSKCNCVWSVLKENDYPNLIGLHKTRDTCLFCN